MSRADIAGGGRKDRRRRHILDLNGNPDDNSSLVTLSKQGSAVILQLTYDLTENKDLPLNFDLVSLLSGISGPAAQALSGIDGLVDVSGSAKLHVLSASTLNCNWVRESIWIIRRVPILSCSIPQASRWMHRQALCNMNFTAAAGPLGISIKNGTVTLDADGDPVTTAPASFAVGFKTDAVDHRYYLSDLGFDAMDSEL